MMRKLNILLVEDEPLLQREIAQLIDAHPVLKLFAIAGSLAEARHYLDGEFDVLVTDKRLPDGNGVDLIRLLNERQHQKKTMVMTVFEDEQSVLEAIDAGVDGYFVKQDPNLVDAIYALADNRHPFSPSVGQHFINRLRRPKKPNIVLTEREMETLEALADGLKYHEIAQRLNVSRHTVPDYIKSLYRKLDVHDRASAVYVGVQNAFISVDGGG